MSKKFRFSLVVVLFVLVLSISTTLADSVVVFVGSSTSGIDGRPQNGQATFSFVDMGGGNFALTITLENTAGPGELGGVSSVIYGLNFELSGGGTLSLSSASAPNAIDCTSGTCMVVATPTITWTYASGSLVAPLPLQGIVNGNIVTTDGIPNAMHNPYLNSPVTFNFLLTGGPTNGDPVVSDVFFRFGTGDGELVGVPEPMTLTLLGTGLLWLGVLRRRSS
jgi:hypothetical protein